MTEPVSTEVDPRPRLLTVEEAAEELRVSEKTVRRLIKDKRLRSVLVSPRVLRIPAEALDDFLEQEAS